MLTQFEHNANAMQTLCKLYSNSIHTLGKYFCKTYNEVLDLRRDNGNYNLNQTLSSIYLWTEWLFAIKNYVQQMKKTYVSTYLVLDYYSIFLFVSVL